MSRILDDMIEVTINEKKYRARLDLLAISEAQFYFKSRGWKNITVPQFFEEIQNENYFIICNLLIFSIKSCNPTVKMVDIWEDLKFVDRSLIIEEMIKLINASMPKEDEDKKKENSAQVNEEN